MDSPRSERSQTRFSTPVSELDDHRFQPSSLPRADTVGPSHSAGHTRDGTLRGDPEHEAASPQPNLFHVNEELRRGGTTARDFEHAIMDEDNDRNSITVSEHVLATDPTTNPRGSVSPGVARRGTLRRTIQQEAPKTSRSSSSSSRSMSPPNSVDAFADPRRRDRAGTIGSKAPSDLDLTLHRSVSGGTHRRRPTFSEGNATRPDTVYDGAKNDDSAEEDVCFPPPQESHKTSPIDFEALEEFVAESTQERTPLHGQRLKKQGVRTTTPSPRVYDDVRTNNPSQRLPAVVAQLLSPSARQSNDSIANEKLGVGNTDTHEQATSRPTIPRGLSQTEINRFSFFSSELDASIHAAEIGDLVMPGETFYDLFSLAPEGGVWWLDVFNPTEEEVNALSKAFSIHPLTSEDIKTQETREKVELFKQYYFVCFRSFFQMDKSSEDYMEPVNVYVVVFREGVLSFTFSQSPHAANVRRRIGKLRDYVALSADWICYAMIDDIVDTFGPVIHDIEQETDIIEDQVFVARADDLNSLLRQIGECRKKVMGLMRLLGGKADVIKGFAKRCNEQYSVTPRGEIGLYLGDIQDHVVTMMSNLGHFEKMLSRSHSNYLAQLSVDSIAQGSRANEVLSKITLIATILVPLNLICGLFGMNVPVPGKDSDGLAWFFGILGVIGAIVVFSLCAAKKFRFI